MAKVYLVKLQNDPDMGWYPANIVKALEAEHTINGLPWKIELHANWGTAPKAQAMAKKHNAIALITHDASIDLGADVIDLGITANTMKEALGKIQAAPMSAAKASFRGKLVSAGFKIGNSLKDSLAEVID